MVKDMQENKIFTNLEPKQKNYKIIKKYGQGHFCSVYKALRQEDNNYYALKIVKFQNLTKQNRQSSLNEIQFLSQINCPFIVGYFDAFFEDDSQNLYIVLENLEKGDLSNLIRFFHEKKQLLPEKLIWQYIFQIGMGIKILHYYNICHRDIKTANILIGQDQNAKIADFNIALHNNRGVMFQQGGTPMYAAPEIWNKKQFDSKSDCWSFGCIIYEMCKGHPPFQGNDMDELLKNIQTLNYKPIPNTYSNDLQQTLQYLLVQNPNRRYSIDQFFKIPYYQQYNDLVQHKIYNR
ncbi:Protein kinase-like domain [Pseudocohnilembus persalinus]|uniref:non-specific serine/threonine protein kinase n=1 Tax=Pseudocohnilembus persalinus TaxID=266149 RepID=A0A0V0R111_PSEPJ|nr:Protein kinase-like domain [Pseudocohnilembus persalinus]|eukprot:KRX07962.1 Protein kinase-like domain [Pseudocohnilembus persalinus]